MEADATKRGPKSGYTYAPGAHAILEGLTSTPELNGERVVVDAFDTSNGKFNVTLAKSGATMAVRPCCLAPAEADGRALGKPEEKEEKDC